MVCYLIVQCVCRHCVAQKRTHPPKETRKSQERIILLQGQLDSTIHYYKTRETLY